MVEISNIYELLAVHRALLELKYIEHPNSPEVVGSPFVAQVAHRILDALIDHERRQENTDGVKKWETWRLLDEDRREWKAIERQIKASSNWGRMNEDQKRQYVLDIAIPFKLASEKLAALITKGDEFHA